MSVLVCVNVCVLVIHPSMINCKSALLVNCVCVCKYMYACDTHIHDEL